MNPEIFYERRKELLRSLENNEEAVLLLAATPSPRNFPANPYWPFRQDSHFLYYTGIKEPGYALLLLPDGEEILFYPPHGPDDVIWEGPKPTPQEIAERAYISYQLEPMTELKEHLQRWRNRLMYLPPYRPETLQTLSQLLDLPIAIVESSASEELAAAVVNQRNVKSPEEIEEIERALGVTQKIFYKLMKKTKPGKTTRKLLGRAAKIAYSHGFDFSFQPIITQRGEILHASIQSETLETGRMLLVDLGLETPGGYCSDITRTWPVDGRFTPEQRDIYTAVLKAQQTAIETIRPGINFREVHLKASLSIAQSLTELKLLRGNPEELVEMGVHALLFPHGLGHLLGLDVHDMEDLGDRAGYPPNTERSQQFGLNFLRLARDLQPGFVVTVEPGIYFIRPLIKKWWKEERFKEFVDYQKIWEFSFFGGIRIEDDVLVTAEGARVLGPEIPKKPEELESIVG